MDFTVKALGHYR